MTKYQTILYAVDYLMDEGCFNVERAGRKVFEFDPDCRKVLSDMYDEAIENRTSANPTILAQRYIKEVANPYKKKLANEKAEVEKKLQKKAAQRTKKLNKIAKQQAETSSNEVISMDNVIIE